MVDCDKWQVVATCLPYMEKVTRVGVRRVQGSWSWILLLRALITLTDLGSAIVRLWLSQNNWLWSGPLVLWIGAFFWHPCCSWMQRPCWAFFCGFSFFFCLAHCSFVNFLGFLLLLIFFLLKKNTYQLINQVLIIRLS